MNRYQEALNEIGSIVLDENSNGYETPRCVRDFYFTSYGTLQNLVNKAESFEWISVEERLPREHDSIFAKLYGTDKWNNALWRTRSKEVLVTIEYEDGVRTVKSSHTTDGKWVLEQRAKLNECKVVAWKPFPEPYKEIENE